MILMTLLMLLMMFSPLLLVGLIVLAVGSSAVLLAQGRRLPTRSVPGAREVLARRYAQGEISKEQYDQMLADIAG